MNSVPAGLLLEAVVCVFLAATIGYCWVLNKRLQALRSGQDGLRDLIRDLNKATGQAANAINDLTAANAQAGAALTGRLKDARELADELGLMINSGNSIADRLGRSIDRRHAAAPAPKPAAGPRQQASQPQTAPQRRDGAQGAPATQRVLREPHPLVDAVRRTR
ncbi:DUF6468 domain-containing protein [uncultured Parvibaculum sp.]|uniref:DUF6468 domain-containing protein n=1 Tax=uncultured Parvibaculum sp. TaxID=291828 RepID=UPI0030DAB2E7